MNDPYQVLHVPSDASEEEIKRAYRELARKYHPDNYHGSPLEDLAQEKMKEINEAYEWIRKQRQGIEHPADEQQKTGERTNRSERHSTSHDTDSIFREVRAAIQRGDISLAERLLKENATTQNAEWHFLMGYVCLRRGWMEEAKRYFEIAICMEPDNEEYRESLHLFTKQAYRPPGYPDFSAELCNGDSCTRWCAAWVCCNLLGGGGACCYPCF